jgi:hypothetical protein
MRFFSKRMMERIDYWRGFTGGFLAGVAIGAWIYLSPGKNRKPADLEGFDPEETNHVHLRRDSAESAGDPSWLIPENAGATRMDFQRPSQNHVS